MRFLVGLSKVPICLIASLVNLPDEIETIKRIDAAVAAGELFDESAIDWN